MQKWILPSLMLLLVSCGADPDQQVQVQFAEIMQEYRDSEAAEDEKILGLKEKLDNLIENNQSTPLVQQLLRGEAVALGMSLSEIDSKAANAKADRAAAEYAGFFAGIVTEHCIPNLSDLDALTSELQRDDRFRAVTDFEGSYETEYNVASFAVTPDAKSATCTVDVMLVTDNHDLLFTFKHIDSALQDIAQMSSSEVIERTTHGANGKQIHILEKEYTMSNGAKLKLLYPSTALRDFFMQVDVKAPTGAED